MATRRTIPYTGMLVHDDRIRTAGAASTLDAAGSSYQQAGPTAPGAVEVADGVVLGLAGNQASSVYLDIGRGGAPDPARGARLRWADSSTDPLLGWAPPTWVQYATGGLHLTAARACDMVRLADGKVAVAAGAAGAATETTVYDPSDDSWAAGADLPWQAVNTGASFCLLALWQDPTDDAVYCLQADTDGAAEPRHMLVRSTNGLSSWSTLAQVAWSGGTVLDKVKRARWYQLASGTHVLVLIGTAEVQVWRSSSGEDWRFVGSLSGIRQNGVHLVCDVVLLPDGRLLTLYCPTANTLQVRGRLCDPLADLSTAAEFTAQTFSANVNSVFLALEETGRAWCMASVNAAGSAVLRSVSYSTWLVDQGNGFAAASNVTHVSFPVRCIQLRGGHLLAQTLTSTGVGDPVFYRLGGWTTLEPWMVVDGLSGRDSDRITWGGRNTAATPWQGAAGSQIAPTLSSYGWGRITAGSPTPTETATAARRRLETAGVQLYYTESSLTGVDSLLAFADFQCLSGGSVSATNVGIQVRAFVGSNTFVEVEVFARPDALRVKYAGGSTLATASVNMQEFMQVMICIESARRVEVYYKRPYDTAWTSFYQDSSPTTNSPSVLAPTTTTGGFMRWGHCVASTAISEWRFTGFQYSTSTASATAKRDQWRSTGSTAAARQQVLGRPLGQLGGQLGPVNAYPAVSLLSVVPTAGSTATVQPAYAYPVDHLDPVSSPSPRQVWRSTDTSEQVLEWVFDATNSSASLTHWGLYVAGANFRTAILERWDGAAWQTWAQVDMGLAITYTRTGDTIQASSGSLRWTPQATVNAVRLSGTTVRAVAWQRSGYGSDSQTRMRARLEGVQPTDPASGTGMVQFPQGVAASLSAQDVRRVRLRIPASQPTPTGYYEAGVIAIGPIYALGTPEDFGSSQTTLLDVQTQQLPGYRVRQRRSPPRRRWSLQVAESSLAGVRDGVAGYLAPDGASTLGIGIEGDTAPLLEGLLAQGLDAAPVLVLPAPPQTESGNSGYTLTETRSDVLWWGTLQQVSWDNVVGVWGSDELQRIATLTIEEDR